jgi:DNA polymerase
MTRRAAVLAEMGIAPVWRLKAKPALPEISPGGWIPLKAAVSGCVKCGLHKTRTQTVFGVGDENADWMLIGEAPGAEEDRLGDPFVGQAGKLLDNMLTAIGLSRRANVYIANVLKCRPPANRNPTPEEVAQCSPHLLQQIELIKPKLIVAMGRFAAQTLLETGASISSLRGRVHRYAGVPLIVTYHPAYLLRTLEDKAKAWEDLLFAKKVMSGAAAP